MTIQKSIEEANKQKRGITREAWGSNPTWIIPTNTYGCMIMITKTENVVMRWNPTADDISAVDWIVYG